MNPLIPLYVTLQTFVQDRVERLREHSDRGVSALEYAGLAIIVGAVFTGIVGMGIPGQVKSLMGSAITSIFSGGK